MRKASPELSLRTYQEGIDAVLDLLSKVVSCDRLTFSAADKRELAEALVFKVTAEWEVLVEELFVDLMNKDNSQYAETVGVSLPKHQTRDQCQAMLIGTGYFDFKNCGDLKGLAKNYLVRNLNPFRALNASTSQRIDEMVTDDLRRDVSSVKIVVRHSFYLRPTALDSCRIHSTNQQDLGDYGLLVRMSWVLFAEVVKHLVAQVPVHFPLCFEDTPPC